MAREQEDYTYDLSNYNKMRSESYHGHGTGQNLLTIEFQQNAIRDTS